MIGARVKVDNRLGRELYVVGGSYGTPPLYGKIRVDGDVDESSLLGQETSHPMLLQSNLVIID